jgi:hypothetical protein
MGFCGGGNNILFLLLIIMMFSGSGFGSNDYGCGCNS